MHFGRSTDPLRLASNKRTDLCRAVVADDTSGCLIDDMREGHDFSGCEKTAI
jgi:hypothetical protein